MYCYFKPFLIAALYNMSSPSIRGLASSLRTPKHVDWRRSRTNFCFLKYSKWKECIATVSPCHTFKGTAWGCKNTDIPIFFSSAPLHVLLCLHHTYLHTLQWFNSSFPWHAWLECPVQSVLTVRVRGILKMPNEKNPLRRHQQWGSAFHFCQCFSSSHLQFDWRLRG